jgi:CRP/FNR family transcriptional regulator, polysaccharide utilization system transcription regulator
MPSYINTVFCKNCTKKLNIFNFLTDEETAYINEHRHEVRFNPGETIFKQGGALTHIACMTSGYGKVYIEGMNKKDLVLNILRPTEMIGGPGMFNDYRHHYSVSAIDEVTACFIEVEAFIEVSKQNTEFTLELFKWINSKGVRNFEKLINLTQKQMPGRIADALLYLSNVIYENNAFTVNISRQDIADIAAMSKESAIRIIKEFKESKLITCEGNNFEILDIEALQKISQTG